MDYTNVFSMLLTYKNFYLITKGDKVVYFLYFLYFLPYWLFLQIVLFSDSCDGVVNYRIFKQIESHIVKAVV